MFPELKSSYIMANTETLLANLEYAKHNQETLYIGGGEFSPNEVLEYIKPKSVKIKIESVSISWGISRGRGTYGWNICRAVSRDTGNTFRTIGGGYDMVGTVIGEWFAAEHQQALQGLVHANLDGFVKYGTSGSTLHNPGFYGLYIRADGIVYLDGACGIESMLRIIEACGFEYQRQYNPRTHSKSTTGYLFSKEITE